MIFTPASESVSIWTHGKGQYTAFVTGESLKALATICLPEANELVFATTHNAVRVEAHCISSAIVPPQYSQPPSRINLPEADCVVSTGTGQYISIRIERYRIDSATMPVKNPEALAGAY